MKKLLMALCLTLLVSATCFAEGVASRFNAEEKAADALISGLIAGGTYEEASKGFSKELKAKLTADQFASMKRQLAKEIGKVKKADFILLNKQYSLDKGYNGIDELVYMGTVAKDKFARFFVAFALENNAPKIVEFQVRGLEAKAPEASAKK